MSEKKTVIDNLFNSGIAISSGVISGLSLHQAFKYVLKRDTLNVDLGTISGDEAYEHVKGLINEGVTIAVFAAIVGLFAVSRIKSS